MNLYLPDWLNTQKINLEIKLDFVVRKISQTESRIYHKVKNGYFIK